MVERLGSLVENDETDVNDQWLDDRTIGELLDDDDVPVHEILVVEAVATVVEVAARMCDARTRVARILCLANERPAFLKLPVVMEAILRFREPADGDGDGA